jgi:hypothetical protein
METMSFAYMSADDVNRNRVARMATARGATLYMLSPTDPPPDGRFDVVLYDLDSMPPKRREEIVASILGAPSVRPVAVHSYNLGKQASALREKGVVVADRLGPGLFQALCRSLGPVAGPQPSIAPRGRLAEPDRVLEIIISAIGVACRV